MIEINQPTVTLNEKIADAYLAVGGYVQLRTGSYGDATLVYNYWELPEDLTPDQQRAINVLLQTEGYRIIWKE